MTKEALFILAHVIAAEAKIEIVFGKREHLLTDGVLIGDMYHVEFRAGLTGDFMQSIGPKIGGAIIFGVLNRHIEIADGIEIGVIAHLTAHVDKRQIAENLDYFMEFLGSVLDKAAHEIGQLGQTDSGRAEIDSSRADTAGDRRSPAPGAEDGLCAGFYG